ncbi:putative 6-aminohexanoate-dimer hydrolase protein [Rhizobium etli CFN 42]|uniref:6-aminohexanoate-dimer hydrolase protein n=1 Tax=Rhizobium etli (strain ATCC 51251 / DSM 11541 / JCM 21823 / NBRC 15573 / CFN 42) TaxID=347834 RepID=Q2K6A3_RHIEC|nr:serine hydrolase [Rhizobium etli]ABC91633.1 putative 6-aminohexanoate-dimer hydrolase protein [Rhizobium etli CFN 42]AGS22672.1 beta-lactamase/transpeptidase-like protein [Rhizobium etli bv. mimosae str. Mim1]
MQFVLRVLKALALLLVFIVVAGAAWLFVRPPELLRVGDGYAAKIVCSNVFIAGRDADDVLHDDVQAPGNPLLRLMRVSVDRGNGHVTARFMGLFAPSYALYRSGLGCTSVPDADFEAAANAVPLDVPARMETNDASWPQGEGVGDPDRKIAALLGDSALAGPAMRAIVVVRDGRIVAEAYGPRFSAKTPLIGWSMTKTVNAAILGRLMLDGKISFDDDHLLAQWKDDQRARIKVSDLLGMESGLAFNEDYGDVADVTRMLYLDPDMVSLPANSPMEAAPGQRFRYSSGTAVLLSRIWMNRIGNAPAAFSYPRDALFSPLGMTSAVFELDARGTFVGSSYLYATAHDWARFGQFLLQDGVWNGRRLLPEGFVGAMRTPTAASNGRYTQGQAWLAPGGSNTAFGLPEDTFWLTGHDGQSMAIVPSANLIVVRLGLTPGWLGYQPQTLLKAVLAALPQARAPQQQAESQRQAQPRP